MDYFDSKSIDGVEIDGKIVDLANKYFDLPQTVNTYVDDGRSFLTLSDKKYDVIMVDAYQDITIPFQMSSKEFFTEVSKHLKSNGSLVVNMNMYTSNEGGINDYLTGTIKSVFNSVYTAMTSTGNVELFASNDFDCKKQLASKMSLITNVELKNMMSRVYGLMEEHEESSYILTDDKAPVELLGMTVLDQMIVSELDYYRNEFKSMSVDEIIKKLMSGELF